MFEYGSITVTWPQCIMTQNAKITCKKKYLPQYQITVTLTIALCSYTQTTNVFVGITIIFVVFAIFVTSTIF